MSFAFRSFFFTGGIGASVSDAAVMALVMATWADGRDGEADLDGTNEVPWATRSGSVYTCIRIGLPSNVYVRVLVELKTAGYPVWANGDWSIWGSVTANGNNASGATAGAATAAGTLPATIAGGAGGAAGGNNNGTAGGSVTTEWPTAGRFGGAPGGDGAASTGGVAGGTTPSAATRGTTHGGAAAFGSGSWWTTLGVNTEACASGGSGGGGNASGAGGGGGASGGINDLSGRSFTVYASGVISANGGNGGNGGTNGGAGSGGGGGRVRLRAGYITLADPLLNVQVRGGQSGVPGAGGSYGNCGMAGEIVYLAAKPSTLGVRHNRVALTAGELLAVLAGGVLDISFSFVVGSDAGRSTGTYSSATGGGGLPIFLLDTPDGEASLRFNSATLGLDLRARGAVVLSTTDLATNTLAGPCFQPFRTGDVIEGRAWYDPAGGARSMGIRWAVNRTFGYDEVGVASGSPLAAATAGTALSSSTTSGSWGPAPAYILASRAANMIGSVVVLGDSITAVAKNSMGWDGVAMGSRCGWSVQTCLSLARAGAKLTDQLTAWQASPARGSGAVVCVAWQLGHNDINAGDSAATVTANSQAINDDVAANNPTAKRIISKLTPSYSIWTPAQRAIWDAVQANYDGTGGTPVTGVHARATAHLATMGDANKVQRERCEVNDYTHPNFWGRSLNARSLRTAYDSTGLAA